MFIWLSLLFALRSFFFRSSSNYTKVSFFIFAYKNVAIYLFRFLLTVFVTERERRKKENILLLRLFLGINSYIVLNCQDLENERSFVLKNFISFYQSAQIFQSFLNNQILSLKSIFFVDLFRIIGVWVARSFRQFLN